MQPQHEEQQQVMLVGALLVLLGDEGKRQAKENQLFDEYDGLAHHHAMDGMSRTSMRRNEIA